MKTLERISWIKAKIQSNLFPHLEENLTDVMTEKQKKLIMILEMIEIEKYVLSPEYQWMGRKLKDRYAIARAFVAKAVYNYATTRDLIEGLKGVKNLVALSSGDLTKALHFITSMHQSRYSNRPV